jgi:hypothetical protein
MKHSIFFFGYVAETIAPLPLLNIAHSAHNLQIVNIRLSTSEINAIFTATKFIKTGDPCTLIESFDKTPRGRLTPGLSGQRTETSPKVTNASVHCVEHPGLRSSVKYYDTLVEEGGRSSGLTRHGCAESYPASEGRLDSPTHFRSSTIQELSTVEFNLPIFDAGGEPMKNREIRIMEIY